VAIDLGTEFGGDTWHCDPPAPPPLAHPCHLP
jgi:hypothetical protein